MHLFVLCVSPVCHWFFFVLFHLNIRRVVSSQGGFVLRHINWIEWVFFLHHHLCALCVLFLNHIKVKELLHVIDWSIVTRHWHWFRLHIIIQKFLISLSSPLD